MQSQKDRLATESAVGVCMLIRGHCRLVPIAGDIGDLKTHMSDDIPCRQSDGRTHNLPDVRAGTK